MSYTALSVVHAIKHAASKRKTGTNMYTFNESTCMFITFAAMVCTTELNHN